MSSEYIKIPSTSGGSYNNGLKKAIICIGKYYGNLDRKKKYKNDKYLKCGIDYITKHCGRKKEPIRLMLQRCRKRKTVQLMIQEEVVKKSGKWCFHKTRYEETYRYIIRLLNKLLIKLHKKGFSNDKLYIVEILKILYQDIGKIMNENNGLTRVYSNALILMQKEMLEFHRKNRHVEEEDRIKAGDIIETIKKLDKIYSLPPKDLIVGS